MAKDTWRGNLASIDAASIRIEEEINGIKRPHYITREFGGGKHFGPILEHEAFRGAFIEYTITHENGTIEVYELTYTTVTGDRDTLRAKGD